MQNDEITLSFCGLDGALVERRSITSSCCLTRGCWRGCDRKTGQLLPAGRTKPESGLELFAALRAEIDGHSARK